MDPDILHILLKEVLERAIRGMRATAYVPEMQCERELVVGNTAWCLNGGDCIITEIERQFQGVDILHLERVPKEEFMEDSVQ
jgi:hypothetical protein